jgi:biopolymer transport protein ExbB/TolQ
MHEAFGTVLWIVCAVGILIALAALITGGRTWEEYGKSRMLLERDVRSTPRSGSAGSIVERDAEIRQLLQARNARRARRGEAPIDIEQEFRRLTASAGPQIDDELRGEIRDLVVARNHRRARLGKPPLDVESEIEREIASLRDL